MKWIFTNKHQIQPVITFMLLHINQLLFCFALILLVTLVYGIIQIIYFLVARSVPTYIFSFVVSNHFASVFTFSFFTVTKSFLKQKMHNGRKYFSRMMFNISKNWNGKCSVYIESVSIIQGDTHFPPSKTMSIAAYKKH